MRGGAPRTIQYTLNITLSPHMYHKLAETQYDETVQIVKTLFKKYDPRMSIIVELTKQYNVHYHGIVDFEYIKGIDYKKYIYDSFRNEIHKRRLGRPFVIDVFDFHGWKDYIIKDLISTYNSLNRFPVVLDDFDLIPEGKFRLYGIQDASNQ